MLLSFSHKPVHKCLISSQEFIHVVYVESGGGRCYSYELICRPDIITHIKLHDVF